MNTKALYQEFISQEAVAFQGGRSRLFAELTGRLSMLIESGKTEQIDLDRLKLSDIVFHQTGLNIDFRMATGLVNASAVPPVFDVNNPLLDRFRVFGYDTAESIDELVVSYRKITSFTKELTGSIDRKNSRVNGVFSKVLSTVHIGSGLWSVAHMTAEEVAAVVIHEIGHVFTFIETLAQAVTMNLVLQSATQALSKTDNSEIRLALIYEAEQALDVKLEDVKSLAESRTNATTIQAILLKAAMEKKLYSAADTANYDLRSSEFAADQFAVRHGAGRVLFMALDKLHRAFGGGHRRSTATWVLLEAFRIASIIFATIAFPYAILFLLAIFFTLGNPEAREYDDPRERFLRIRNDLIQALKDQSLPKKQHDIITADIQFIDKAIEGVKDRRGLLNYIWIALTPSRRHQYKQMRFQQELEQIVNNDLFLKASQLKQH